MIDVHCIMLQFITVNIKTMNINPCSDMERYVTCESGLKL